MLLILYKRMIRDSNYIAPYEKLRLNGTLIQENNDNDHLYKYRGIYIDLFYLEPALPFFFILYPIRHKPAWLT